MKFNKDHPLFFVTLAGVGILFFFFIAKKEDRKLNDNKVITNGLVTDYRFNKAGVDFEFEFYILQKRYINSTTFGGLCHKLIGEVRGRSFPVIYERGNPENSRLLITEKSFRRFDIGMPDSLNWVKSSCK